MLREVLRGLLRELIEGPPGQAAYVVNPGDRGLLGSLAKLSAADASARPGGRSSVAAHVDHVRFGFALLNRWFRGENPFADADYAASWTRQQVTEDEWRQRRDELEREARAWVAAFEEPREWNEVTLNGAISSVAHLAYHLGAIRQVVPSAGGPPENNHPSSLT